MISFAQTSRQATSHVTDSISSVLAPTPDGSAPNSDETRDNHDCEQAHHNDRPRALFNARNDNNSSSSELILEETNATLVTRVAQLKRLSSAERLSPSFF
jgi:hypothetical protein